jgi:hypothetical protein
MAYSAIAIKNIKYDGAPAHQSFNGAGYTE